MTFTTILLNSSNVVANTSNTKYTFSFQSPTKLSNSKIAVGNLQLYYSWFNISSFYNNNTFYYIWTDGNSYQVTIPDGSYSIDTLNAYLQSVMVANTHYLYDTVNQVNKYYLQFRSNITYYTFEFNASLVPTSAPQGFTKPGSWAFPATAKCPQVQILSINNFQYLVGLNPGLYPPTNTQYTPYIIYSQNTPKISPVTALVLRCNLIKNKLSNPVNDILYSFAIGSTSYADSISEKPSVLNWCDIADGQYNDITVQFFDQDLKPMVIKDNQILLSLVIDDGE